MHPAKTAAQPQDHIPQIREREELRGRGINYAIREGVRGTLWGLVGSAAFSLLLRRYSPTFRAITFPGKAMFVAVASLGTGIILSEHAIYRFNRPFMYDEAEPRAGTVPHALHRYRYEIIVGLSVATLAGMLVVVDHRHPRMTWTQKFMNARLWAQAVGIGGVVAVLAAAGRDQ